jgi:protein-disulfide isomerase
MGKSARIRAQRRAAVPVAPRRRTDAPLLSRGWLYGGLAGIAVAIAVALILVSVLGGKGNKPTMAVSGVGTAQLLSGIPQSGLMLGSPSAPVTLIEYADLQCPYCDRYTTGVMPTVIADYVRTGKMRVEFRGLNFIGADSEKALRVALAAGEQNKLWNVVDLFYLNQGGENDGWVTDGLIRGILRAVPGLDASKALAATNSGHVAGQIAAAQNQAVAAGVSGTPTFFVHTRGGGLEPLRLSGLTVTAFKSALAPYVS